MQANSPCGEQQRHVLICNLKTRFLEMLCIYSLKLNTDGRIEEEVLLYSDIYWLYQKPYNIFHCLCRQSLMFQSE